MEIPESRLNLLKTGLQQLRNARKNLLGVKFPEEFEDELLDSITSLISKIRDFAANCEVVETNRGRPPGSESGSSAESGSGSESFPETQKTLDNASKVVSGTSNREKELLAELNARLKAQNPGSE